jgi:ABC-2 type transport system permease protein
MPIYEQTYRIWEARGPLTRTRFWPITREALRLLLGRWAFLGLLALGWLPFLFRAVQVFVVTRVPDLGRVLPVDGRIFGEFLNGQILFAVLIAIFGGAGLVANDLRTGAILVYLSRPLTRRDYVLGKLGVLLVLTGAVTLAPAALLYAVAVSLAPSQFLAVPLWWIAPAILGHGLLVCLVISLLTLAVSALGRSGRAAGLALVLLFLGLDLVGFLAGMLSRWSGAALVSIRGDLALVGQAMFGVPGSGDGLPVAFPLLLLAALLVGCVAVLRWRVRAVEIVS